MIADQKLGNRQHKRVDLRYPVFVRATPTGAWAECSVINVSETGICIDVKETFVPKTFGIAFKPGLGVRRVCIQIWRQGSIIGARYA
jgi:hypothetical protein